MPGVDLVPDADPVVVSGIPLGAECTATEGEWGQTEQIIGTATVGLDTEDIGLVSVENVYDVAALRIRKAVDAAGLDADGNPIEYGPFAFALECEFAGQPAYATGYSAANPMTAELTPVETWALAGLPVGAECTVEETDDLGAESTTMTVNGSGAPVTIDGTSADVVIEEGIAVQVAATNAFAAGDLHLEKVRDGAAADDFGAGPFVFAVVCTLDTGSGPAVTWADNVVLDADNGYETTIEDIAAGSSCDVAETEDGGATSTVIETSPVTIAADDTAEVVATNTFDAGALAVTKVIDGEGAELWGAGPFEVTLDCLDADGAAVGIPGGAARTLDADNDYSALYEPLLIGLDCTLSETDSGGATSTTITDAETGDPVDVVEITAETPAVVVTNTFDMGDVAVVKTVSGGDAAAHADDEFEVTASCVWDGATIEIPDGAVRTVTTSTPGLYEDLPVGAECAVQETDAGGADATTYTPESEDGAGAVVTVGATDVEATITIDNRFDSAPPPPPPLPPLPPTGSDATPLFVAAGIAALLIVGGAAVLLVVRRRRVH